MGPIRCWPANPLAGETKETAGPLCDPTVQVPDSTELGPGRRPRDVACFEVVLSLDPHLHDVARHVRQPPLAEEIGLRGEKAVAGIKFQAIQDLQKFAMQEDPRHSLFSGLWRERGIR